MKKMNLLLLIACCLTSYGYAQVKTGVYAPRDKSLQEKAVTTPEGYEFQQGDTIVIDKEQVTYLTGEKMSSWVYEVPHLVQQQGGKRFPNGLLIQGIYSWIPIGAAKLLHEVPFSAPVVVEEPTPVIVEEPTPVVVEEPEPIIVEEPMPIFTEETPVFVEETPVDTLVSVEEETPVDTVVPVVEPSPAIDTVTSDSTIVVVYATHYQADRFSIGVRGGVAEILHGSEGMKDALGWDVLLDLQYAHYWKKNNQPSFGILLGASVGYLRGGLTGSIDTSFVANTDDGIIDYHVSASKVKENQDQLMVEVPIMFSMVTDKGFFLNAGPRISFPVWTTSKVVLTDPSIDALFRTEGVHVPNELITGKVSPEQNPFKGTWKQPILNVLVGAELGYEFKFKNGNSLGLGLYGNYGVYSLYEHSASATSVIDIVPPSSTSTATVSIVSPSDVYTSKMGMFDVGLKLTFHVQKQRLSVR